MRLVTFQAGGDEARLGALRGDENEVVDLRIRGGMLDLIAGGETALSDARRALNTARLVPKARLLAPLVPTSIRDFATFEEHIVGAHRALGRPVPPEWYEVPAFFKEIPWTVIGHDAEIPWPRYSTRLDYELEIAAIIGKPGRDIPADRALEHIFGWTIWNDLTARDTQVREIPVGFGPGKAKDWDGSNVIGPCIATSDEVDGTDVSMVLRINGEEITRHRSSEMHHPFDALIAYVSQDYTLRSGELLGSGTAPRGSGLETDRYVKPGDVIEMEIEGIGVLRNVVGPKAGSKEG